MNRRKNKKEAQDRLDEANKRQQSTDAILLGFSNFIQTDRATAIATAEKKKRKSRKRKKDKKEKEKKEKEEEEKDKSIEKIEGHLFKSYPK